MFDRKNRGGQFLFRCQDTDVFSLYAQYSRWS